MEGPKTEQLNRLFEKWVATLPDGESVNFFQDGIIQEDLWDRSPFKVAFLLKEVNKGKDGGVRLKKEYNNDLRQSCREDPWLRLGQWAYALWNPEMLRPLRDLNDGELKVQFKSCAIINLKKIAGGASAAWKDIRRYASHEKEFLQRQLAIIDPKIVVCGGRSVGDSVFNIARDISLTSCKSEHLIARKDVGRISASLYVEPENQRVWIDFVHPSIRGKHLQGCTIEGLQSILSDLAREFYSVG